MQKTTCIIIEDEMPAQEVLRSYIDKTEWLKLTGVFGDAMEALDALQKSSEPDLIFLDIEMPGINGLGLLKILQNPPGVIITSAYSQYAVDAFDLEVHDYLMKPFSFDRFLKAVTRVTRSSARMNGVSRPDNNGDNRFAFFNVNKTMVKVLFNEIRYVESMRDYVYIHTGSAKVVTRLGISEVQAMLGKTFLRVHRSFLVNTERVSAYNAEAVFIDDLSIPVGTNYKKFVEAAFHRP
jgi:DNA-binding LytR/AlgR family response regulator